MTWPVNAIARVINNKNTPTIQVSCRGYLYAPNRNTWQKWISTTATMKLEPQPCTARRYHPRVTSWLRCCRLFHASAAEGTYVNASRMPVATCNMKSVSAALPNTYHQLAELRGTGWLIASRIG